MKKQQVPQAVLEAAAAMLSRFIPDVSPDTLEACLKKSEIPHPAQMDQALTKAEAAQMLGVSKMTIFRLMKSGKLRYFRLGDHCVRIPQKCIIELMEVKNEDL